MREPDIQSLLECTVRAAQAAGGHALKHYARRGDIAERFKHDVKLQLDLEAQREAERVILHQFPDHAILGEEGATESADQPRWIIDPIDGTVNFSHGMPIWCSCVGVEFQGEMLAGAVYAPQMEELYTASIEHPALCNGNPIHASTTHRLEDALILTGLTKTIETSSAAFDLFRILSLRARKVRIMGAAAVDICHVACGRADAYVETGIYLWDVAAAGLIARRAGARTDVLKELGEHKLRYICTNAPLHDIVRDVYTSVLE